MVSTDRRVFHRRATVNGNNSLNIDHANVVPCTLERLLIMAYNGFWFVQFDPHVIRRDQRRENIVDYLDPGEPYLAMHDETIEIFPKVGLERGDVLRIAIKNTQLTEEHRCLILFELDYAGGSRRVDLGGMFS